MNRSVTKQQPSNQEVPSLAVTLPSALSGELVTPLLTSREGKRILKTGTTLDKGAAQNLEFIWPRGALDEIQSALRLLYIFLF